MFTFLMRPKTIARYYLITVLTDYLRMIPFLALLSLVRKNFLFCKTTIRMTGHSIVSPRYYFKSQVYLPHSSDDLPQLSSLHSPLEQ